jgi:cbb3-type cytochrome oxidase subunit 3
MDWLGYFVNLLCLIAAVFLIFCNSKKNNAAYQQHNKAG